MSVLNVTGYLTINNNKMYNKKIVSYNESIAEELQTNKNPNGKTNREIDERMIENYFANRFILLFCRIDKRIIDDFIKTTNSLT